MIRSPKTDHQNKLSPIKKQIVRSATSPALNYGEALSAESKKDFIHKLQIVTKELRETFVCLKIIKSANLTSDPNTETLIKENNELISIFVATVNKLKKEKEK